MIEKYKRGPVGMLTVFRSGPPAMPKYLAQWFVYFDGLVYARLTAGVFGWLWL